MIDWDASVGYKVKFIYDNIEDEIEIGKKIDINKIFIYYKDKPYEINKSDLRKCKLGRVLGKNTSDFLYDIGSELKNNKRDLTIIDREYRKDKRNQNHKYYKYHCNKCGYEGWLIEYNIKNNYGCSCCAGKVVVKGINDVATTDPWMMKYFVNEQDAFNYTSKSRRKVYLKCPDCGYSKYMPLSRLHAQGFGCQQCSDGISYPNKFMFNLLTQLDIEFISEYSPEWSDNKRYDFYIPSMNLIIEMDGGLGHGKVKIGERDADKTRNIDKMKDEMAKINGLNIIRINCDYKAMNDRHTFIKSSILHSDLSNWLNLNYINWNEIETYCLSSMIKRVCDFRMSNTELTIKEVAKEFKLACSTISCYCKIGEKLGWYKYQGYKKRDNGNGKPVDIYYENNYIGRYKSITYIVNNSKDILGINIYRKAIRDVCNGKTNNYKGYVFKFVS